MVLLFRLIALDGERKPGRLTYIWVSAVGIQWVLYLSTLYARLPEAIIRYFWDVSWLTLVVSGLYCAWREWPFNKGMSLLLVALSMGQLGFYLFVLGITSM